MLLIALQVTNYIPDLYGGGGKTTDMWLLGALIYGVIVAIANFKLLQDSKSINWLMIVLVLLSISSFFLVFLAVSYFPQDELFWQFHQFFMFP